MPKRTLRTASPEESWRPVLGYEGLYEVSDHGQVRRVAPAIGATVGYILKEVRNRKGYPQIGLSRERRQTMYSVHLLVAAAFIGPRPAGHECNHRDGNKSNNHVSNLEWLTPSENSRHALRLGLMRPIRGERNGNHKLTQEQVDQIRELRGKETGRATAARFNVSPSSVSKIQLKRVWHSE